MLTFRLKYVFLLFFSASFSPVFSTGEIFKGIHNDDNSVAFSGYVSIGGIDQYIEVRGKDGNRPVLLILQSDPGASDIPMYTTYNKHLEDSFVVALWDQRGTGKSFYKDIPDTSMTYEQLFKDTFGVIEWLCKKFDKEKLFLYGASWGGTLGIHIVSKYPDLIYGCIASSPILNTAESMILSNQLTLHRAESVHYKVAIRKLKKLNPPFNLATKKGFNNFKTQKKLVTYFGGFIANQEEIERWSDARFYYNYNSLVSFIHLIRGVTYSYKSYGTDLQKLSFNTKIKVIPVPFFLLLGRNDLYVPPKTADLFFKQLKAPEKKLIWFEHSAHFPSIDESDTFNNVLFTIAKSVYKEKEIE